MSRVSLGSFDRTGPWKEVHRSGSVRLSDRPSNPLRLEGEYPFAGNNRVSGMGYEWNDLTVLSDKKLRLAWESNLAALGKAGRRLGARDRNRAAGRRLDAEMMKRWKARQAAPGHGKEEGGVQGSEDGT